MPAEAGVPRPFGTAEVGSEGSEAVACLSKVCAVLLQCAPCIPMTYMLAAPISCWGGGSQFLLYVFRDSVIRRLLT